MYLHQSPTLPETLLPNGPPSRPLFSLTPTLLAEDGWMGGRDRGRGRAERGGNGVVSSSNSLLILFFLSFFFVYSHK